MAKGLSAEQGAQGVGVPRWTLYRWEKSREPGSRRPKRLRQPKWPPPTGRSGRSRPRRQPDGGKRKIAAVLKREGQAVSVSKVGRVLRRLMDRGAIVPAPVLRRKARARRFRPRRKRSARQAHRQPALQGQGNPSRRRIRVHVRLRGPWPRQTPRTRRPAA
jgi:hypothetical protein